MKKCGFFRLVLGDNKKPTTEYTEGFCETYKDNEGNEIIFCFHSNEYAKNKKSWSVTEKSTGLSICSGFPTRQAAAEELINKYLNLVFSLIQKPNYDEYKRQISIAYEKQENIIKN